MYDKLAYWLYERADRAAARKYADRLRKLLKPLPDSEQAIVGALGWSTLAEMAGKIQDAIAYRQRIIPRVHSAFRRHRIRERRIRVWALSPCYSWVLYGRLAELYCEVGQPDKALGVLEQSQVFCSEQGLKFECRAFLGELRRSKHGSSAENR